jgi:glycosyltransferase involved in cell wall biosynthesis
MARIAVLTPTFPPYRGGIGTVAETDASQLASLGHDVHVFAPGAKPGRAEAGYMVHALRPWLRWGHGAFVPGAASLPKKHDLVVLHYPFFGGAEPLAAAMRLSGKGKVVLTYHMDVAGTGALRPFIALHARTVMPGIVRRASRVLVTSLDYARSSAVAPLLDAEPERFRELAPGVDVARFAPGPKDAALVDAYRVPAGAPTVVFCGGLDRPHYFKGVPVLLRALATRDLADARAILVGDGGLRPSFERLAASLGVAERVAFAGSVPDDALAAHLRLGDVFAFPSTDRSEAFGIAALEALACGVPVVASDLPGVRTIVRDGATGATVRPGSASALALALARLFAAPHERARMAESARRMAVEEYALDRRREKWATIVKETL